MSIYSLLLCCWKRAFTMTSEFSWQNSISLCPASFCTLRPNLPITLGITWLPTLAFQSPIMKKTSFFWVLVLEDLIGLHRTVLLQLLQHYWSGHRLGLLWYWMVCLGNEQRSFCHFSDCIQVLHFGLLLTMMATPFLNSPIPVRLSPLIPRMLMFTLVISCLTTSNLPWFMDLTFQVPMQYCSLQHRTFHLSLVPSTTGYCFCFGYIPSFFLELFLHWSPVAYWAPTNLGSLSFSVLSFCLHKVHGVLWRRKWQPTPVFLLGESQGRGSLVGCRLRGRTESDMTEVT